MARNSSAQKLFRDETSQKRDGQAVDRVAFGKRVSEAANRLGKSDAAIAREAGVGTSTFGRYRTGEGVPNSGGLFPLADALGVSPRWLLYGDRDRSARLADVRDADFVDLPRYDLGEFTETSKGEPVEVVPFRKDWLNRALGQTNGLWLAEAPNGNAELGLYGGEIVICSDVPEGRGPGEGWACLWLGPSGPMIAQYSVLARETGLRGAVTPSDVDRLDLHIVARVRLKLLSRFDEFTQLRVQR